MARMTPKVSSNSSRTPTGTRGSKKTKKYLANLKLNFLVCVRKLNCFLIMNLKKFTDELYKEHLKKALIDSKLEFESHKVPKKDTNNDTSTKQQKANKPVKMSLDEFQKSFESNYKSHLNASES